MQREFTGRHMLLVLVIGFGIVVAVNFFMASVAARGFSGVVVENSYVASQKFNSWLAEAEHQQALGWEATMSRGADGHLIVDTTNVPTFAELHAELRRPLGAHDVARFALVPSGENAFVSPYPLPEGRWIVRLQIDAAGQEWRQEEHLP